VYSAGIVGVNLLESASTFWLLPGVDFFAGKTIVLLDKHTGQFRLDRAMATARKPF
jgi:hypothetical protein